MSTPGHDSAAGRHEYGVVFCGGGPAATGAIICAAQEGRLNELLERGVLVVEKGERLGPGSIGHYRITGNTRGITFLRCLDRATPHAVFDPVRSDAATRELQRRRFVYPPLSLVGPYLARLGAVVEDLLDSHPACMVARRTAVQSVRLLAGGGVCVSAEQDGEATLSATAGRAVIAMGGCERPAIGDVSLLPGLTLDPYADKVCRASMLIDDRLGPPQTLVDAVREKRSAVVVGGSHSAWSAAWILVHDPAFRDSAGNPPDVTVLHRSPLRLFYMSTAEAIADGYTFDETMDVCPVNGRVNRYGGLRGDAHKLARAVIGVGTERPQVTELGLVDDRSTRLAVLRALDDAGLVAAAFGYDARLPELVWPDGRTLEPAVSATGLVVTPEAQLVSTDGTVVHDVLAYGLGAGLSPSAEVGGERSYRGRADAVWLYQNEVGRIALDSILSEETREAAAYS